MKKRRPARRLTPEEFKRAFVTYAEAYGGGASVLAFTLALATLGIEVEDPGTKGREVT